MTGINSPTAPVAKIIPFSAVDGPGNRTAVFIQGCNMNCLYCHNPETINRCVVACPAGLLAKRGEGYRHHLIWLCSLSAGTARLEDTGDYRRTCT